jgi:hypothetical protein
MSVRVRVCRNNLEDLYTTRVQEYPTLHDAGEALVNRVRCGSGDNYFVMDEPGLNTLAVFMPYPDPDHFVFVVLGGDVTIYRVFDFDLPGNDYSVVPQHAHH